MFEEIRQRVAEGDGKLQEEAGSWSRTASFPVERLLSGRGCTPRGYLLDRFGKLCTIGSNVDSFGHNHVLPRY